MYVYAGVNPMITVEAMAYMVAKRLAEQFQKEIAGKAPEAVRDRNLGPEE
jgi:hypothetical protein